MTIVSSDLGHFAIEQIKNEPDTVFLSNLKTPPPCSFVVGVDSNGEQINVSLDEMTHALVAGCTGSGKTVFINSTIYHLLLSNQVKVFAIDKKRELNFWQKAKNCEIVVNDEKTALGLVRYFQKEMNKRYKIMSVKKRFNLCCDFTKWVLIVDELAELMLGENKKEIEKSLVSLCQLGRAAGIHCILCTQSPRVAVVSGLIQANTPTKVIFKTANIRESVLCLGHSGAEKLLGNGDCLLKLPKKTEDIRIQAPYISNYELNNIFKR